MGVFLTFGEYVLMEISGGGDGAVYEGEGAGGGEAEGSEADGPAFFIRGGVADAEVSGGGDEGLGVALFFEVVEDEVGGEAFGDAAEVELHVFAKDGDGLVFFVEGEVFDAAAGASFGDLFG